MKYLLLATLVTLSLFAYAQRAAVRLKDGTFKDINIKASSSDAIYIEGGSIKQSEIDTILFGTENEKFQLLYDNLKKNKVVMIFGGVDDSSTMIDRITLENKDGSAYIQKVIEVPGKSASELFALGKRWVALTFVNTEAVTQSVLENEMIRGMGVGAVRTYFSVSKLQYEFKLDFKDGKVRFTMYSMYVMSSNGRISVESYIYKKDGSMRASSYARSTASSLENEATLLIHSLKEELTNSKNNKKDDW